MQFEITCVCGQQVRVDGEEFESAVTPMVAAMDAHVASAPHPDVPPDLTLEQREGMVRARMAPSAK